jgi:hypothetical protein
MDRGRTAGGGQEPTTPPMMAIKGFNTLKLTTALDLRSKSGRAEVLEGSLHNGMSAGVGPGWS